jgi:hypothetical protein
MTRPSPTHFPLHRSRLVLALALATVPAIAAPAHDWLVDPAPFVSKVSEDAAKRELTLENGLVRRVIRLTPNAATVDYKNLVSGEQMLRATGPEAKITLDGVEYAIGGLEGQPCLNFLKPAWIDALRTNPEAYRFSSWREEPVAARFPWKKRPEWLAKDYPWPAPGKTVTLGFIPPAAAAKLAGKLLFEDRLVGKPDPSWQIRVSPLHPRSSFNNEGKAGEIYTPPETAVYAERPWPKDAVSAEVTVDAGDDTLTNVWGPGLALVTPSGKVAFVLRPNQARCDINGEPLGPVLDRAKAVTLRVRIEGKTALCEASQDGRKWTNIGSASLPATPTAIRVGRVGRGGEGKDDPAWAENNKDKLVRCHVSRVAIFGAEPEGTPAPAREGLPMILVHYTIYDGLPLIEKWITIRNTTAKPVRVDRTIVETLKIAENESSTEQNPRWESSNLYVETDYAFMNMTGKGANQHSVRFKPDRSYGTQINYELKTPCLLEVEPEFGPGVDLAPGAEMTSIRAFELFRDSDERERRGLAQRRMYRTIAPWSQENPVMVHLISNNPDAIRKIVDQGAEVGVEMIILSFGSGMNMESTDPAYQAKYKEVADYARGKGIVIGSYSLLASRGAGTGADNCRGPGNRVRYGVMPCLGAKWGQDYLKQMRDFLTNTGFAILEHDGSYPGDTCAAADHPFHKGLADSQWVQFQAIADLYKWCRANGIYLNIPDWYYLNGASKCAMNYKENNWSLPRAEQEIIERQNIYDGTWEKTSSMGWMFVPLTQYHGGGAAATIEPLCEHLDHYETRLANLFGAGVQACYRGPRIYDTDQTKELVKKWISFYKAHREVLDADLVHLRRPDGRDWDGFVHVNPQGKEKALAFFYNPLEEDIEREIRVPLHYAGLSGTALLSVNSGKAEPVTLDAAKFYTAKVRIPARGRTWLIFTSQSATP